MPLHALFLLGIVVYLAGVLTGLYLAPPIAEVWRAIRFLVARARRHGQ